MKQRYVISACLLGVSVLIGAVLIAHNVSAQTTATSPAASIQYPVAELGNCANETACRAYCDDAAHTDACLAFAEKHQLMSQDELQKAKKFTDIKKGPGGCTTKESCKNYCDDISHINECVAFAEQNGMMSGNELAEAKKVQAAIAKGVKPPACSGKDKCDAYCSDPSHMEECVAFGKAAGLMSDQEIQDSEKVLAAIKQGVKPPACRGKEECDSYCRDAAHMEECMTFAKAAGFMSAEEAAQSEKMLQAIKKGVKPPACNGKEECDKYCSEESHIEECIAFSEAAGFMTPEEATMARKTGGKGPGGCTSKEECEAFCNNPANQETCFNFGKEHGMIPAEDLRRMEEGKQQLTQTLNQAPPEVITCISNAVGNDTLEKIKSGAVMPSQDLGDKMGKCFQQIMSKGTGGPGEGGFVPPQGQAGPGGCKSEEECKSYCTSHPDECKNFGPARERQDQGAPGNSEGVPGGMMIPPGQSGPGGCKNAEECRSFCESNPDACANFKPGNGPQIRTEQRQEMMTRDGSEEGKSGQKEVRNRIEMMPGVPQGMIPGDGKTIQEFFGNMPINTLNPVCPPGAPCGPQNAPGGNLQPGTEVQQNNMMPPGGQGMQQPLQQFQPPTAPPSPGGQIMGPPPGGEMMNQQPPGSGGQMAPPPTSGTQPPAGGTLYQAFQFLLNGITGTR